MDNEFEQLIHQDSQILDAWAGSDPLLPRRLQDGMPGRRGRSRPSAILAWASVYGLVLALLVLMHLLWIPGLESPAAAPTVQQAARLHPYPEEVANDISRVFLEVASWEN